MTAPLSPDEGVRAALCPDCGREKARNASDAAAGKCPKWWAIRDKDAAADCERVAALSTPVPEEGLLRGSASAAEGGDLGGWTPCRIEPPRRRPLLTLWQSGQQQVLYRADYEGTAKDDWRNLDGTASGVWPIAWRELPEASRELRQHLTDLAFGRASAEPGAGAASALPSPLPSQGEPVAWVGRRSLEGLKDGSCQSAVIRPLCTDIFAVSVPLYTAEALAAAKARADRAAEDEREACAAEIEALGEQARRTCAGARGINQSMAIEALHRWTAYQLAARALRARTILKETPLPPSSSPEDQEKAAAIPTIADPDGEVRS